MIGCKCKEIEKWQNDLSILREAKKKLKVISRKVSVMEMHENMLATNSPDAYETNNINDICNALTNIHKDTDNAINLWTGKVDEDISMAEETIQRLQKTDTEYHNKNGYEISMEIKPIIYGV